VANNRRCTIARATETQIELDAVTRIPGSRIVLGAVAALLLGIVLLVSSTDVHFVLHLEYMLTTAALGVAPVVVGALCSVPLVRRMEDLRIPVIAQAFAAALVFAVLCCIDRCWRSPSARSRPVSSWLSGNREPFGCS
jgi:hypothetical protein